MMSREITRHSLRVAGELFSVATHNVIGTITHVTTDDPVAALTFDDGPDPEYTPKLLDILKKYRVYATFFMVGEAARAHPELVRRIAEAGHAIANHSWNHPSFPLISSSERRAQIRACAEAIAPFGERLFRPPYAQQDLASRLDALLLGYRVVMFDVCSDDWCGGDPEKVAGQIERRLRPGSVIVLHDGLSDALDPSYFNREPMIEALEIFLTRVSHCYRFVTIPELLRLGRPHREFWYKPSDLKLLNKLLVRDGPGRRYTDHGKAKWIELLAHVFPKPHPR